jgi:hypothetical protein
VIDLDERAQAVAKLLDAINARRASLLPWFRDDELRELRQLLERAHAQVVALNEADRRTLARERGLSRPSLETLPAMIAATLGAGHGQRVAALLAAAERRRDAGRPPPVAVHATAPEAD